MAEETEEPIYDSISSQNNFREMDDDSEDATESRQTSQVRESLDQSALAKFSASASHFMKKSSKALHVKADDPAPPLPLYDGDVQGSEFSNLEYVPINDGWQIVIPTVISYG